MRLFGTFLSILALACLVVGAATAVMLYSSGIRVYDKIQSVRQIIEDDIDRVQNAFSDVDAVYVDSKQIVDDYERGQISGIQDERVRNIFKRINATMESTRSVKERTEADIKTVENLINELTKESLGLVPVAITCIICLVVSGWLFGFGVSFRSAGRG
jgi:ElaB/YqjD/DUF883 family membrane-anchored ribosome-binding protein